MATCNNHLGLLQQDWFDRKSFVIYGFGVLSLRCIDMFLKEFNVPFIIDNDPNKAGKSYKGIPIITLDEAVMKLQNQKIVVISVLGVYINIATVLEEKGFIEHKDFAVIDLFVAEWYWHNKKQIHLIEAHSTITEKCSFNCKNCNMFMPYYKEPKDYSFEEYKQEIDTFFSVVDRVFVISLLGGEPFINPELKEIILYIHNNYKSKYGKLILISNASILPSSDLVKCLKECEVFISISDYTASIPYTKRLNEFVAILKNNSVQYEMNKNDAWLDFGFPDKPNNLSNDKIREHMLCCGPLFRGFNNSRFYYCHVLWSAERCGLKKRLELDSMDLRNITGENEKRELIDYSLGKMQGGYLSLCKQCGGCGVDNKAVIPPGIQVRRESNELY